MIKVAVLGAGRIGQIHAANVAANPRAKLVAVADPIAASGKALAEKLNCESVTDAEELIARSDIDAVVIGTPSDTHARLMLLAAHAGKAVLLPNGDILTSSGRTYGRHPGRDSVFLRGGSPGTVDLTDDSRTRISSRKASQLLRCDRAGSGRPIPALVRSAAEARDRASVRNGHPVLLAPRV